MKIFIAGAGIGGLTAALCLAKDGHDITILERADDLTEVGAGLQCGANAVRVLQYLGLEKDIQRYSEKPEAIEFREYKSGAPLYAVKLGANYADRYGAAYHHIHRADLMRVLHRAVEQASNIHISLSSTVERYLESSDSVQVILENGESHTAELLIGCDGLKSTVRSQLLANVGQDPRFTGNVAWRATVPGSRLPADFMNKVATNFVGPNKHIVMYYLRDQQLLNLVGVVENNQWRDDSWVSKAPWEELAEDFRDWHPMVTTAINALDKEDCYRWALFDHAPLSNWSSSRVTLLGDAAHATLPFMASGAALAIEDARILQRCMALETELERALKRYQKNRLGRTSKVQNTSRKFATLYHIKNPWLLRSAFGVLRFIGGKKEDFLPEYDANSIPLK